MTPGASTEGSLERTTSKDAQEKSSSSRASGDRRVSIASVARELQDMSMGLRASGERDDRRVSSVSTRSFRTWRSYSQQVRELLPSHILREKTDDDVIAAVQQHTKELQKLKVENTVFRRFLEANRAELLIEVSEPLTTKQRLSRKSSKSIKSSGEEILINTNRKSDLVYRDMELRQADLDAQKKKFDGIKGCLKAKFEELEERMDDIDKSCEHFEQFRHGDGPISIEKFVRYFNESLKKSQLEADKIRLRYSSMKVQYQKLVGVFNHKQLIGENLQEIDFEQLRIENVHLADDIEKKRLLLLELKRMTGDGNLKLTQVKKILQQRLHDKELFSSAIQKVEDDINKSDDVLQKMNYELDKVKDEYDRMKYKITKYKAPEVLEYVMKKREVEELKKTLKTLSRRKLIKEMALKIEIGHMKRVLWTNTVHPCWFE